MAKIQFTGKVPASALNLHDHYTASELEAALSKSLNYEGKSEHKNALIDNHKFIQTVSNLLNSASETKKYIEQNNQLNIDQPELKERVLGIFKKLENDLHQLVGLVEISEHPKHVSENNEIKGWFENEWGVFLEALNEVLPKKKLYKLIIKAGFISALGLTAAIVLPLLGIVATKATGLSIGGALGMYLTGELNIKEFKDKLLKDSAEKDN